MSTIEEVKNMDKKYFMNIYGDRTPVCFDHGKGYYLYDTEGKEYIDFFGGIAVNALGYSHKNYLEKVTTQLNKLIHTSNIYYIKPQAELAKKLVENSCADKVLFCSTGAEANEGAIKLARLYFKKQGFDNKYEIITLKNSFHGRTLATLAATGQEKYQKPFEPLIPGFKHVEINNIEDIEEKISSNICAVMLELIQGESGVNPIEKTYIKQVKKLCNKYNCLLIFDEVQTGMGRTGKLFAYEHYDVEPDIFTLAKALGGGIPIGAVCAKEEIASKFSPSDHGTTFGGNPLSSSAGLAVMQALKEENLVENAKNTGMYLKTELCKLKTKYNIIKEVRGKGLMIGIEFTTDMSKDINKKLLEKGFIVGSVGKNIIRFLPPLIIDNEAVDKLIIALDNILASFNI